MPMTPKPTGSLNQFPRLTALMQSRIDAVVRVAALNIAAKARSSMEGAKSGRTYRVPGTAGRAHVASAAGEAPAILSGQLHGSIDTKFPEPMLAFVYTNDEKGPHLEFGTHNMAARPFFAPAAADEERDFVRALASAIGGTR